MNFKELIRKHGYNLSSLAKKLGLDRATTLYWVRKRTFPRRDTLERLSELLDESVETLVDALRNS